MRSLAFPLIFAAVVVAGGCGKSGDEALFGKWRFDREFTQSRLPQDLAASPEAAPLVHASGLPFDSQSAKLSAVRMLFDQLNGAEMVITPQFLTDITGRTQPYEIVARGEGYRSLKTADGKIETWKVEDDRLALSSTGDVSFMVYFRRVVE